MTCSVDAYPRPYLLWKKDGQQYHGNNIQHSTDSSYVSDLILPDIKRDKGGNYTCSARGLVASKELYVKCKYVCVDWLIIQPINILAVAIHLDVCICKRNPSWSLSVLLIKVKHSYTPHRVLMFVVFLL